jgi:hypothetical protein
MSTHLIYGQLMPHEPTKVVVTTQGSSLSLTNTTKKTWNKLFDANYKVGCKVTYACYTSLWKVLGGKWVTW